MNREEFLQLVDKFNINYRTNKLEKHEQEHWWKSLQNYSYEDVNYRFDKYLGEGHHYPIKLYQLYKGLLTEDNKIDKPIECGECYRKFKFPEEEELYHLHRKNHMRKGNLKRYLSYWDKDTSLIDSMPDIEFDKKYRPMLIKVMQFEKEESKLNPTEKACIMAIIQDDLSYYQSEISKQMGVI